MMICLKHFSHLIIAISLCAVAFTTTAQAKSSTTVILSVIVAEKPTMESVLSTPNLQTIPQSAPKSGLKVKNLKNHKLETMQTESYVLKTEI